MIIITKVTGQLGNRLQIHAHLMAAALELDALLVNPCLTAYAAFFTGSVSNAWGRHDKLALDTEAWPLTRGVAYATGLGAWQLAKPRIMRHAGMLSFRARNEDFIDVPALMASLADQRWWLMATRGLHFYAPAWVARHAAVIRRFFTPRDPWRGAAERRAVQARGDADILVGVHVRHGDYATHHGGRWFYALGIYANLMRGLAERLAPQRVRFLVCGNAIFSPGDFSGVVADTAVGHLVEDLHALAQCDFIMGPPSSFSGWAAFWGGRRLYFIDDPERVPDLDDFRLVTAPDGGAVGCDRSGGRASERR